MNKEKMNKELQQAQMAIAAASRPPANRIEVAAPLNDAQLIAIMASNIAASRRDLTAEESVAFAAEVLVEAVVLQHKDLGARIMKRLENLKDEQPKQEGSKPESLIEVAPG